MPKHMFMMSFNGGTSLNNTLDRFLEYALAATVKKGHYINFCYIGTASQDSAVENMFFTNFANTKFWGHLSTTKLNLTTNLTPEQIEKHLKAQDIIFIGGGNTQLMLKIWKETGFIEILNKLKQEDCLPVIAGVSSGGMWPFAYGITDSIPGEFTILECLGWQQESFCSHVNVKTKALCEYAKNQFLDRKTAYEFAVRNKLMPSGFAVPDNCMLHFYDGQFVNAFTTMPNVGCEYVTPTGNTTLETIYLTKQNIESVSSEMLERLKPKEDSNHHGFIQARACSIM